MFFSSIKEITRLWKEINRLLRKGMSNIYLKFTIEKKWRAQNFDFISLKSLSPGQFLWSFKSHRYHWIFKLFFSNLTIRGLEAKSYVACLLFLFWKELWRFLELMLFVKQKYINFNKNETDLMENYTYSLRCMNHVLQLL